MKITCYLTALFILNSGNAYAHKSNQDQFVNLLQSPEVQLLDISEHLYNGEFDAAEGELKSLLAVNPKFRLAHFLYAELMAAKSGLGAEISEGQLAENNERFKLIDELRRRNAHRSEVIAYADGKIPDLLLQLSPSQKQVVVVDENLSRAHVFRNIDSQLSLVGDFYITVGKNGILKNTEGDGRTPTGVYFITSRLDPIGLDDLYGDGALALNYPNEWDQRLGRSGFGIWLHGVPSNTYNRAPFATEGCVAFPNEDISFIFNLPEIENTPVIITQQINWVEKARNLQNQRDVATQIMAWKDDWASGDFKRISPNYGPSFSDGMMKRNAWLNYQKKALVRAGPKKFELSDLSIFRYPDDPKLVVVSFSKEFPADANLRSERIRQYWRLNPIGAWQIVFERPAEYLPVHFQGIPEAIRPLLAEDVRQQNKVVRNPLGS